MSEPFADPELEAEYQAFRTRFLSRAMDELKTRRFWVRLEREVIHCEDAADGIVPSPQSGVVSSQPSLR